MINEENSMYKDISKKKKMVFGTLSNKIYIDPLFTQDG